MAVITDDRGNAIGVTGPTEVPAPTVSHQWMNEAIAILVQMRTNWRRALNEPAVGLEREDPAWGELRDTCERIEALLRRAGVRV